MSADRSDPEAIDGRIVALMAGGQHREAATEAIRGYGPQILRYLRNILGNGEDAREAFSQFAENLWVGLPGYRGDGAFRAWTYRIAWSVARDMRKSGWQRRRRLSTSEAALLAETVGTSTDERVEERRRQLDELRSALSLEDRALAALRIDQNLAWEEIADVLSGDGIRFKPNTLAKRFERVKEHLGRLARRRGLIER